MLAWRSCANMAKVERFSPLETPLNLPSKESRAKNGTSTLEAALDRLIADWPGPAARLARSGDVAGANAQARPMLNEFATRTGDLGALAAEIVQTGAARLDTVVVPGAAAPVTLDVACVPVGESTLLLARDVSLAANMRNALADSRRRYKDIVEHSAGGPTIFWAASPARSRSTPTTSPSQHRSSRTNPSPRPSNGCARPTAKTPAYRSRPCRCSPPTARGVGPAALRAT